MRATSNDDGILRSGDDRDVNRRITAMAEDRNDYVSFSCYNRAPKFLEIGLQQMGELDDFRSCVESFHRASVSNVDIITYHECADPAPRFRCTQLISKLLRVMDPQSCLPMELFDAIRRVLLQRSQDVKRSVRIQAIYGLARLQNPLDKDCPVVAALLWLARHDKIPEVRHKALVALILTTVTLPYVLERCRDVSKAVRKAAFGILTERSVLRPLSIAQRISIIQDGLTDPSSEVQKAAEGLLRAWFEVADEDPILLLRRLDTEGVPKTSALCLERLLLILGEEALTSMINKWTTGYLDERYVASKQRLYSEHFNHPTKS
ncbi:unnamed protein product [Schistocephalus solidus]|uniref:Adaptin_N domain-containing protein n=1 Tax=Schistocephalus solidus TaxID=70667 RepID=A0A183TGE5_SCHSO|nr:unnamed protein product [Schistocephalus solidus]